jgi:murein DD-endopeptidase MepM/ murein hydrolase activator NlpD/Fe-S-cluster formation regulator IscX/YfhJ
MQHGIRVRSRPLRPAAILRVAGPLTLAACLAMAACEYPTTPENGPMEVAGVSYSHGSFSTSSGIYRIPYADGTVVDVWQDHHTHGGSKDRIDLNAGTGSEIVASAGGWIRFIRDLNGDTSDRGDGLAHDGVTAQDDALEHACLNNDPDDLNDPPNPIVGSCSQYNNYVWIEHPNGEWTKYSHFGTGTVQIDYGWEIDDWVDAGEVLGLEDDIGAAQGNPSASHLHYEAAVITNPAATTLPLTSVKTGFIDETQAANVVPQVCDGDGNVFLYDVDEDGLTADPCDHVPPTADAGGPYVVDEGTPLQLDGAGSSDPEGLPLTYLWDPGDDLDDPSLAEPTFTGGTTMVVDITLTVYDQMEALYDSDNTTITVENVAPTVTIDPEQVTVIDEHGTVIVVAEFTDPGFLDTHTGAIDWGVPVGQEGEELGPPSVQILDPGGPGEPLHGRVSGTYRYGDNDDGAGFTIEVTVTDSDGGAGSASFDLTVENVDPEPSIDPSGAVLLGGVPTVVANAGEDVPFEGLAEDPGSDDLTLTWDWGDGMDESRVSLLDPPETDPLPSPTVQPRSEPDETTHTFAEACLYEVSFSASDDDGGLGADAIDVILVGDADRNRNAGYWTSEYRLVKHPDLTPAALSCYLDIVNHVSAVFPGHRPLASFDDAVHVLWTRGSSDADEALDRQILTSWLNFASGASALDDLVDTTGDGVPDTAFHDVMMDAEDLRTDPGRTAEEVLAMKDALERLNTEMMP